MLIDLTAEQCNAIEEALAYFEALCDRRIEANKHILEGASTETDRIRCEEKIRTEVQANEIAKSIRIMLMKARVAHASFGGDTA